MTLTAPQLADQGAIQNILNNTNTLIASCDAQMATINGNVAGSAEVATILAMKGSLQAFAKQYQDYLDTYVDINATP